MRRLSAVLLAVCSCTTPVDPDPRDDAGGSPDVGEHADAGVATAGLRGRLVMTEHTALAGGRVEISGTTLFARSGTDGRFAFSGLPAAPYRFVATSGALAAGLSRELANGADTDLGDLVLQGRGSVAGTVQRAGAPVANATVVVQGEASAVTANDGTFLIEGLPAGTYQLVAFEGATGAKHDSLRVESGARATVTLTLTTGRGSLSGRALAPGGDITPVEIRLQTPGGEDLPAVSTTADGAFAANDLPVGLYTVRATHRGSAAAVLPLVGAVAGALLPTPLVLFSLIDGPACAAPSDCGTLPDLDGGTVDAGVADAGAGDAGGADAGVVDAGVATCDPPCAWAKPVCGLDLACHACVANSDCATPTPACGSDFACHACTVNGDCPSGSPFCGGDFACHACLVRADCAVPTPACGSDFECHACLVNGDCPSAAPICGADLACHECATSADCSAPAALCGTDQRCHACLSDADCSGGTVCAQPAATCASGWRELADIPDRRAQFPIGVDPVTHRMLVGGGTGGSLAHNDLWSFERIDASAGAWRRIAQGGLTANFSGYGCSNCGVVDEANARFIILGSPGFNALEIWTAPLAGGTYTTLVTAGADVPPGPPVAAIYDAKYKRVIHIGVAWDAGAGALAQAAWSLSLPTSGTPTWTQLAPTGTPPPARARTAAVYDPDGQRLVFHGGKRSTVNAYTEDVWSLTLPDPATGTPAWIQLSTSGGPGLRDYHAAAYDRVHTALIVYGGDSPTTRPTDTWAFDLSAGNAGWTQLATTGQNPGGRATHGMVFDGERVLAFGGQIQGLGDLDDVWQLELSGGLAGAAWSRVSPQVFDLTHRAAAWDPVLGRLVFFGGFSLGSSYLDETVTLTPGDPPVWRLLATTGGVPVPRVDAAATNDGTRTILFGGQGAGGYLKDTWTLPSATGPAAWASFNTGATGAPTGRSKAGVAWDSLNQRLVVVGGLANGTATAEAWTLSMGGAPPGAWQKIVATGPGVRSSPLVAYIPETQRILVLGGADQFGTPMADLWELTLPAGNTGAAWTDLTLSTPGPVTPVAMVYDRPRHRLLVYDAGGTTGSAAYAIWSLDLAATTQAWVQVCPAGDALPPPIQGPVSPTGALGLPSPNEFTLFGWYGGEGAGVAPVWSLGANLPVCP